MKFLLILAIIHCLFHNSYAKLQSTLSKSSSYKQLPFSYQNSRLYNSRSSNTLKLYGSRSYNSFEEYFNRPGPWDNPDLEPLLENNRKWIKSIEEKNLDTFIELTKGHAPKILWIGCSDARVPANEIIGEPPGSVFVHRNIANMVGNTDFNCLSVIQYAVDVLKVKHIIVCGHYDCGGIRAAMELKDHLSPLENWLRNIRDTYRLHKEELQNIEDLTQRNRRLVELNVIEQVNNICLYSINSF